MKRARQSTITFGEIKDTLSFHEEDPKRKINYWDAFPIKDVPRGTVGVFCADRVHDWDRFVVVNDIDSNTLEVIFPRLQLKDGVVLLGQDKLDEEIVIFAECTCSMGGQGGDGYCRCGAKETRHRLYDESFREVTDDNYEYKIAPITRRKGYPIMFGKVMKKHCNKDLPLNEWNIR